MRKNNQWPPLFHAAYTRNIEEINRLLLDGIDPNIRDALGRTALHIAIPNIEIVRILIEYGANVNAEDNNGVTPIQVAAMSRYDQELTRLIDLLLSHGACIRDRDHNGFSVIDDADPRIVPFLIEKGADVQNRNRWGESSLHYLAYKGYPIEVVELLKKAGADMHTKDHEGSTPLMIATEYGNNEIANELKRLGAIF